MTYIESQLLPISSLTHLSYCKRRFALVHIEQQWAENMFTAEGRSLHDKVHDDDSESRGDVRIVRGLRLQSLRLGLVGQADVVEFHAADAGVVLDGVPGLWQPFPVEYKRGKPKIDDCDRIQLCAQAICLEEMLDLSLKSIETGALFYGRPRRREQVVLDSALRGKTVALAEEMHQLHAAGKTPRAEYRKKKCESCSLFNQCLPKMTSVNKDVKAYMRKAFEL